MIYILMGLVSATFFGIGAVTVYGTEGLLDNAWVEYVFWWLIGTGVILSLIEYATAIKAGLGRLAPQGSGLRKAVLTDA